MSDNKKGSKNSGSGDSSVCKYQKCRDNVVKYGFCNNHFDQFKFGLLNKQGDHVPDFDKKFDQFIKQKGKSKVA